MDTLRSPICTRRRSKMLENRLGETEHTNCAMSGGMVNSPMMNSENINPRGAKEKKELQIDKGRSPVRTRRRSRIPQKGLAGDHDVALASKPKVSDLKFIRKKPQGHNEVQRSPICTRRRSKMFQPTCTVTTDKVNDASKDTDTVIGLMGSQRTTFTLVRQRDDIPMNKSEEERIRALEAKLVDERHRADASERKAAKAEAEVDRLGGMLRALQLRMVGHLEKIEEFGMTETSQQFMKQSTKSDLGCVDKMDKKVEEMEHKVDCLLAQHEEDKKQMKEELEREKRDLARTYQKERAAMLQGLLGILAKLQGE
ncbi:hypothetical protein ACLOJK_008104 [Asimina triloba]